MAWACRQFAWFCRATLRDVGLTIDRAELRRGVELYRIQRVSRPRKDGRFNAAERRFWAWYKQFIEEPYSRTPLIANRATTAIVGLLADLRRQPTCFFAYDPGDAFETMESAARRLIAAGLSPLGRRLRCYVLIGFPKDTFAAAEKRLCDMLAIGFTPMAMLWRPETPTAERWAPSADWRGFQRRWARPAIIHANARRFGWAKAAATIL